MPTLEQQVHLLNSELQDLARKNAKWLEYFFAQSEGFLEVTGESPLNCCVGERMARGAHVQIRRSRPEAAISHHHPAGHRDPR